MKAYTLLLLVLIGTLLPGCSSEKKKLKQRIEAAEAKTDDANPESLSALADLYEEYADKFKKDEFAVVYLFKAGETQLKAGNYTKSVTIFRRVADEYPDHEMAGDALYFLGFIYEKNMVDLAKARAAYEELLKKYPKHARAEETKAILPYIGTLPDWAKELDTQPQPQPEPDTNN